MPTQRQKIARRDDLKGLLSALNRLYRHTQFYPFIMGQPPSSNPNANLSRPPRAKAVENAPVIYIGSCKKKLRGWLKLGDPPKYARISTSIQDASPQHDDLKTRHDTKPNQDT